LLFQSIRKNQYLSEFIPSPWGQQCDTPEFYAVGGFAKAGRTVPMLSFYLDGEIWSCNRYKQSAIVSPTGGDYMARNKLRDAAEAIGSAVGKADRKAHKAVIKATKTAKQELNQLSKQVDALKKKLQKSTKQLKRALT
jgi:hypothetical protein